MKVYMATDMEGASGVAQELMTFEDQSRYQEGRRALTLDINAAIRGARSAGASEIFVADGHGACGGYNVLFEECEAGAVYGLGSPGMRYLDGCDEDADLAFCVAYHGMAGAFPAVLDHTQSSRAIVEISVNGRALGELGLTAACCGDLGVPVGLVTGDDAVCAEARELLGEVVTAQVKVARSRTCAFCMAPADARALIETRAREAVERAAEFAPFVIEGPVTMRVQYLRTEQAQRWRGRSGVEMLDGRTVQFETPTVLDAMNVYAGYA
ncbi:MAG: M55 family metallopeptidase [Armatimonadota bacterium]|jgi:D-amino peptidase